ncbi:adenylosuccinate synthase [Natrarchaeobaculum sulfurireducens]|uniref:Adenylosuccinate synthetase n=1 Tax=Natrarchaeobaculum sulfurireducens TaxID=2044521 RepID=A0A346PQD7_9EURY|nr:adenylosuccinate synthase [Natrarchaeobaculum sulfurireducens]AXR81732.1 Adenylosuccinate synthetase [Natrarchaeobaculum sulfurireducens]
MTVTIVGSQLGDEGKGGVVDVYGDAADVVVRYQGGDNAGHTVVHDGTKYKLSLVPSGAVRDKVGVLGNGCVVNPETLFDELDQLRERGLEPDVRVAERAHVILPYHRALDGIEESEKEDLAAGTTKRGIGPTYEDKAGRRGVRIGDLLDPEILRERLEYVVPQKKALAEEVFGKETGEEFDIDYLYETYLEYGERLAAEDMTVDCGTFLQERIDAGDEVMLEGAQGTSLDIDHGVYPYVTSSNPTAGGAAVGSGLGPGVVGTGEIVGIVKGYLSRVGTGPLPTELGGVEGQTPGYDPAEADEAEEELATYIRDEGGEYGTVTGRPRRVGWLDLPMLRHAARASSFTGLAINHVDVLAGLEEVKIGVSYDFDGEELLTMPPTTEQWGQCEATFETFEGWPDVDWAAVAAEGYDAIPENARDYLEFVSDELDVPIYAVGVGPGREETVVVENPYK